MEIKESENNRINFAALPRAEKLSLLNNSSLTDREIELLVKRFINGYSLKECSEYFGLEINSISKNQRKYLNKLFNI